MDISMTGPDKNFIQPVFEAKVDGRHYAVRAENCQTAASAIAKKAGLFTGPNWNDLSDADFRRVFMATSQIKASDFIVK